MGFSGPLIVSICLLFTIHLVKYMGLEDFYLYRLNILYVTIFYLVAMI